MSTAGADVLGIRQDNNAMLAVVAVEVKSTQENKLKVKKEQIETLFEEINRFEKYVTLEYYFFCVLAVKFHNHGWLTIFFKDPPENDVVVEKNFSEKENFKDHWERVFWRVNLNGAEKS